MKKLILLLVASVALSSCDALTGNKKLKEENEQLKIELSQNNAELEGMLETFNSIQEGFRMINEAENRVDIQKGVIEENSVSAKKRIAEDIKFIAEKMKENKEKISKLESQLKSSRVNSSQLKKAIASLTEELKTKQQYIEALVEELSKKDMKMKELEIEIQDLTESNTELVDTNSDLNNKVINQDAEIHTAWYVFGTKSELKEQNILVKGDVLTTDNYNKDYFTKIDVRTTKEIKLYSKRAELMTNHPAGSYRLEKDEKGQYMLTVIDVQKFWSVSKYLVILVK
ncbi:MAG: hypothetical protein Q3992_06685 [Bacteroides sp.]|nr:hypothetical protein [Bacteroides sp.]